MHKTACELVVPDAGPLITLAYADRLDLLLALELEVVAIDMVKLELTRHLTPTSEKILAFFEDNDIRIIETAIGKEAVAQGSAFKKRHAGNERSKTFCSSFMMNQNSKSNPGTHYYCLKNTKLPTQVSCFQKTYTLFQRWRFCAS